MPNSKKDLYVCFSKQDILMIEEFAKKKGALNISQALESLVKEKIGQVRFYYLIQQNNFCILS